jgi:hypothetical protein
MLDRMSLSVKNKWLDEQERVYIIFTLDDIQEYMNCKHDKGVKILAELDTDKGVGLIERVRRGQGKPTIIYVLKFFGTAEVKSSEKPKSAHADVPKPRLRENRSQDCGKTECNKNDISNTDLNENDPSDTDYQSTNHTFVEQPPDGGIDRIDRQRTIEKYRETIKANIEYDILCERYDAERITGIVELMLDKVCTSRTNVNIGKENFPAESVKSRFLKLDSSHIEYVLECLDKNTTKIRNIKEYMLTTLYNAPLTMESYYRAEVNHALYGGADNSS